MDTLVNLETDEIVWEAIKKLSKDVHLDKNAKKFYCKKCNTCFYSKNYEGGFLFV